MPGTTAAICLLPETQAAVVVLQNSPGLCDIADWICQLAIDTLFLGRPAQDYVALTKRCVDTNVKSMEAVAQTLRDEQISGKSPRPLADYCGKYFNRIRNWFIDVKVIDSELCFEFLGREDESYSLRHYHHNVFVWNLSYDELVKRGQYIRDCQYYKIEFESSGQNEHPITPIRWRHDASVPVGELFLKQPV